MQKEGSMPATESLNINSIRRFLGPGVRGHHAVHLQRHLQGSEPGFAQLVAGVGIGAWGLGFVKLQGFGFRVWGLNQHEKAIDSAAAPRYFPCFLEMGFARCAESRMLFVTSMHWKFGASFLACVLRGSVDGTPSLELCP